MVTNTFLIDQSTTARDYRTLQKIIELFESDGDITLKEFTQKGMEVLEILEDECYVEVSE